MLWDIILGLRDEGKTIVLSTHYMDEAEILADRICLMDSGRVVALDTPRQLIDHLGSGSAIEFELSSETGRPAKDTEQMLHRLRALAAVARAEIRKNHVILYTDHLQASLTDLFTMAEQEELPLTGLQTRTASLEDVFIQMTGRSLREE